MTPPDHPPDPQGREPAPSHNRPLPWAGVALLIGTFAAVVLLAGLVTLLIAHHLF